MELSRRAAVPLCVALVVTATVVLTSTRSSSSYADDTMVDLSALYSCKNGDPGVATAYENGNFDINDVDWYLVAQNVAAGSYDCARMLFRVHNDIMHQEMLYVGEGDDGSEWFADGEDYWFNITQYQVGDSTGRWKAKESRAWSSVFLTGTYEGSKYFGWYFCGPPVSVTEKGIAYILKDTADANTGFYKMIKKKMEEAGVLDYGEYTEVAQTDSCEYTWPTAGF